MLIIRQAYVTADFYRNLIYNTRDKNLKEFQDVYCTKSQTRLSNFLQNKSYQKDLSKMMVI